MDDMRELQLDLHSNLADDFLPALSSAHAELDTDPSLEPYRERADMEALAVTMFEWDGEMTRASRGALVFHAFAHFLTGRALQDDFSLLYTEALALQAMFVLKFASLAVQGEYDNGDALLQGGTNLIVYKALEDTASWLEGRFGTADPADRTLADMSRSSFWGSMGYGLDFGTVTTDGGESTVNVRPSRFLDGSDPADLWVSQYGPLLRLLGRFKEDGTPEIRLNWPLGNVAEPDSPHANDATEGWVEGQYRTFLFTRQEIEAAEESRYTLR